MATLKAKTVASEFIMDEPDRLAGYKFGLTNQLPDTNGAATLLYGAFNNLCIGVWDALDLATNPWADAAYRAGNVQVRIIADLDVAVRHPEAFAYASDAA